MSRTSIHWDEVHQRLRASEAALRDVLSENPERMAAVFERRAERLASERIETGPLAQKIAALIFRLGQERYALELEHLSAVLPYQGCTRVPGAAPQLLGVTHVHGELRPVIDLHRVLSNTAGSEAGSLLILRRQVALKIDEVESLGEIQAENLTAPAHGRFVRGILPAGTMLLDIDAALSSIFSLQEFPSQ